MLRRPFLMELGRASSFLASALLLAASISGLSGSSSFTSSFTVWMSFGFHVRFGVADLDGLLLLDEFGLKLGVGEALVLEALAEALLLLLSLLLLLRLRAGAAFGAAGAAFGAAFDVVLV